MAEISYTKTNWVNNVTKLNADNMNHIEDGIKNASDAINNFIIKSKLNLIEKISLTEDTNTIVRQFNNYLIRLLVKIEVPAQTSDNNTYINADVAGTKIPQAKVATLTGIIRKNKTYNLIDVFAYNDSLRSISTSSVQNPSTSVYAYTLYNSYGLPGFGSIKGLQLLCASDGILPTGTVLKIYGVEA